MKKMTIDSSVIIASLLEKEPRHQEASQIWESIQTGNNVAIMPYSVFVEVYMLTGIEKRLSLLQQETSA